MRCAGQAATRQGQAGQNVSNWLLDTCNLMPKLPISSTLTSPRTTPSPPPAHTPQCPPEARLGGDVGSLGGLECC
jgi:hypothetical protein